ncbi:MAG: hypothetical protein IV107_24280 [Paucibacter sp.]|nr:hypothetical protein [Roseateles sp.]
MVIHAIPEDFGAKADLASYYEELGRAFGFEDLPAALKAEKAGLELRKQLAAAHVAELDRKGELADAHDRVAWATAWREDLPDRRTIAVHHFSEAFRLRTELVQAEPRNRLYLLGLAKAHDHLGMSTENPTIAFKHYKDGLEIAWKLVREQPSDLMSAKMLGGLALRLGGSPNSTASSAERLSVLNQAQEWLERVEDKESTAVSLAELSRKLKSGVADVDYMRLQGQILQAIQELKRSEPGLR